MKIRSGFVSNSSSASFCCLGILVKQPDFGDDYDAELKYDDNLYSRNDCYSLGDNGRYIYIDEMLWEEKEDVRSFSLKDLQTQAQQLAEKFNVDVSEVELYVGEKLC
jgi:hypothetical protein